MTSLFFRNSRIADRIVSESVFVAMIFIALLVVNVAIGQTAAIPSQPPLANRLDFESTAVWINRYFERRRSVDDEVADLFRDLGNTDYKKRKAAQRKLQTLPFVPHALIQEYSNAESPEIRFFVRSLISKRSELERMYFHLVLDSVVRQRHHGFAGRIMEVIDESDEAYRKWTIPIAVWASAEETDRKQLMELAASDNDYFRRVAIWGLSRLGPTDDRGVGELYRANSQLKLARGLALVANGDAASVLILVGLVDDADRQVRILAETALRKLSGQWFGFVGSQQAEQRKNAVEAWRTWSQSVAESDLDFFVPIDLLPTSRLLGNYLIGFKSKDGECGLMSLSPKGIVVRHHGDSPSYWAEFLPNGNLLSTVRVEDQPAVVEMNSDGKILWQYDGHHLLKSHRLANGNVLICFQDDKRVVEVTRDKKIVWGMVTNGKCNDVAVLPDGQKLIGTERGLYLIDAEGNEKTIFDELDISGIQVLPDGDLLVTSWKGNKMLQLSMAGEKRWEYGVKQAMSARQSLDGTYAVASGSQGFMILDSKRQATQQFSGMSARVIWK